MFTGLVEYLGKVIAIEKNETNLSLIIEQKKLTPTLKVDESVSHNGICLTVEKFFENAYQVTAIKETLEKTNLSEWKVGDFINLEQAMRMNDRLGGHIVQGHIDTTGKVTQIKDEQGSFQFSITFPSSFAGLIIDKGSITINGVSLTCFDTKIDSFEVSIIPYTFSHTTFQFLKVGDSVNLEFDILGKYLQKNMTLMQR